MITSGMFQGLPRLLLAREVFLLSLLLGDAMGVRGVVL
jgi:hypothetical protein